MLAADTQLENINTGATSVGKKIHPLDGKVGAVWYASAGTRTAEAVLKHRAANSHALGVRLTLRTHSHALTPHLPFLTHNYKNSRNSTKHPPYLALIG